MFHLLHSCHNWWGVGGCAGLLALCFGILWASEHEKQIRQFMFDLKTCLGCINRGEDL